MATLPPEPQQVPPNDSHRERQTAESFGANAELYDRTRPRYPTALIDAILAATPGRDVLDVGVGTGVAARAFKEAGCRVLGVDPDMRMAEFARRSGIDVEISTFEEWDAAERTFDLVTAGQTWHWVDPVAGAHKAGAVLRPGGRIALFWNVMQFPPDLVGAFSDAYDRVMPGSIFARAFTNSMATYSAGFTRAASGITEAGGFGETEQWRFDWSKSYSTAEWLEQVPTFGGHNLTPPDKLQELLDGIGAAIDTVGGSFTMDYAAVVVTAARTGKT
jgi:SAM-dependent methyltransferase